MLKHNLGSTTEKKEEEKRKRICQSTAAVSAAAPHGCPPSPRPPEPHVFPCLFVMSIFPSWPAGHPGRAPRVSLAAHRALPACLAFPGPKLRPDPFSGRFPPFSGCAARSGARPAASRPTDPPRRLGGAGNRRGNKEPNSEEAGEWPSHPIPSYPILCYPIPSHSCRPALERGRERGVVSQGFSVGISLRGAPVPLLRAAPSKVEAAPRGSLDKCCKNRWRRRVCLKSGCGSTPGHFRLSSTPRYQSPGACDK